MRKPSPSSSQPASPELPEFPAARSDGANGASALAGRIHIGPEIDYLERAYDVAKYGDFSPHTLRLVLGGLAAVAVIAVAVVGAVAGLRWSHFVGADERTGQVAVYQGVPVELPLGVHLYHETFLSNVPYRSLSAAERRRLFDHKLRSQSSARAAIQPLELP